MNTYENGALISSIITGPPKALDEDETEFLDVLEKVRLFAMSYLLIALNA